MTDPRVQTTVRWSVVVPSQVMANGVVSAQPAATSIFAMSAGPVSAPRMTRLPGPACTRLTSETWMILTSPLLSEVSGIPA